VAPIVDPVLPLAERLLACLCNALENSAAGGVCDCCLHPGPAAPPMDYCDGPGGAGGTGQAWVVVNRIYPAAARFPNQVFDVTPCKIPSWGAELVMGVYRCVSTLDDQGNPPSCAQVSGDAIKLLSDAAAMRQAAVCCYPEGADTVAVVGDYTPIAPQGGCGGGQMSITVQFYDCCPPPG
jgi:hypothetical protein